MIHLVQSNGLPEPLVIYHAPCLDGFTAAWATWLNYPGAEFVPGVYGQEPPDVKGRNVVLLDFSYKRFKMMEVIADARTVLILDHHKTAEKDLAGLDVGGREGVLNGENCTIKFDMGKSGARLAWEYFHPHTPVPLLVQLVEDRDLWRFALQNSKALNAAFFSYEFDFMQWSELDERLHHEIDYADLVAEGGAIERKHMKDVRELVGKISQVLAFTKVWKTCPYMIPCANLPYTMSSDAAGLMAETSPFAATYYRDKYGYCVFSLRSRESGVDVSEVAKTYGGGGHAHAAGFRIASLDDL